jgi:nicotinate dehydrogenase subunit B
MTGLPASLAANPMLDRWVGIEPDGTIAIRTGKVEIGQGIYTAMAAIAARELGVPLERISVSGGDTALGPDEGLTAGSLSVEVGGAAMRRATALVRTLFQNAAAAALGVAPDRIELADGVFRAVDRNASATYADLRAAVNLAVSAASLPSPAERGGTVDTPPRRVDLGAKLRGAAFIQDMRLPGMLHGRVIRSPDYAAALDHAALDALATLPGVVRVVRDGDFLGVVARREDQARAAAAKARATWRNMPRPPESEWHDWVDAAPADTRVLIDEPGADAAPTLERLYARPFIAHASVGPSCAIAHWTADGLTVWTHSQGVYPLRRHLARVLRLDPEKVRVIHAQGSGCYGHNGADDVALDAALLARGLDMPVMCAWSRAEDFTASPAGAAMKTRIAATLGPDGRIAAWTTEVWSTPHLARPLGGEGTGLLAAPLLADPTPLGPPGQVPLPSGAGERNAVPGYAVGARRIVHHRLPQGPLRSSALRSLGAHCNVFAIEQAMDELSERSGTDPVAFRLAHLAHDPRARAVIEAAARMARWQPGAPGDEGIGRGIGYARYKNLGAYCAIVAEVEATDQLRLTRVFVAVDCGAVVDRDGLANQIEGGVVQAASWTLLESLHWNAEGPTVTSWADYKVLRFSQTPEIRVEIISDPGDPPLGAGEAVAGPLAGALGNALAHALGVRVRRMPLTAERIRAAIEAA